MLPRLALLAALALALGCASRPALTPPSRGGPPWRELSSPHITLHTDLGEAEARQSLDAMEQAYLVLAGTEFPPGKDARDRVEVVSFARELDFHAFAPPKTLAYFDPGSLATPTAVPTLLMQSGTAPDKRRVFVHELTRLLVLRTFGETPPWFDEGLAEYYSTLTVANGYAYLGTLREDRIIGSGGGWGRERSQVDRVWVPIDDIPQAWLMLDMSSQHFYVPGDDDDRRVQRQRIRYFMGAWALVHLLHNGPPEVRRRYLAFLTLLHTGQPFRAAWQTVFGDVSVRELESACHSNLLQSRGGYLAVPFKPPPSPPPEPGRTMSDAEVQGLWARLHPLHGG